DPERIAVPRGPVAWPEGRPAVAGVSSFGFGGTNAHLVLGESPADAAGGSDEVADGPWWLLLSARTASSLRAGAAAWCAMLSRDGDSPPLRDLCYTAAAHRAQHAM